MSKLNVYKKLNEKFSNNFGESLSLDQEILFEVEIKADILYNFGQFIKNESVSETQKAISGIFDEIFSDLSVSIYLALCSIDSGSRVLVRRVLDLGIAVLYFFDMPHKFWHWKTSNSHESDLSFRENVDYLASEAFKLYLLNEHGISWSIDKDAINKLYRELSNVVHGKYDTFETKAASSFDFDENDFRENIRKIVLCENILISCLVKRFPNYSEKIKEIFPSFHRYKYGY